MTARTNWHVVLHHVAQGRTYREIAGQPQMPTAASIQRKMEKDPRFRELMFLVRKATNSFVPVRDKPHSEHEARYDLFISELERRRCFISEACLVPGTPRKNSIYKRMKKDSQFRARVRACVPEGRGAPFIRRLKSIEGIADEMWTAVLGALRENEGLKVIERRPDMPTRHQIAAKRATDPAFDELFCEAYDPRKSSSRYKRRSVKPVSAMRAFELAKKLAPQGVSPADRDDIVSTITMAILEGEATEEQVRKEPRKYVNLHYRMFSKFGPASLDQPIGNDPDGRRLGDTISADAFHF